MWTCEDRQTPFVWLSNVGQTTRPVRDTTDTTHSGTQPLALNAAEGIHATFGGGTTKVSVQNIQNKYEHVLAWSCYHCSNHYDYLLQWSRHFVLSWHLLPPTSTSFHFILALFATVFCWVSSSTSSASATNLQPIPFPWIFFWLRNRFAVFNDTCNTSLLPWGLVSPSTSPWTFDSCRSQLRSGQVRQKLLTKWWYEQVWVGISEHFQTAVYRNVCV